MQSISGGFATYGHGSVSAPCGLLGPSFKPCLFIGLVQRILKPAPAPQDTSIVGGPLLSMNLVDAHSSEVSYLLPGSLQIPVRAEIVLSPFP